MPHKQCRSRAASMARLATISACRSRSSSPRRSAEHFSLFVVHNEARFPGDDAAHPSDGVAGRTGWHRRQGKLILATIPQTIERDVVAVLAMHAGDALIFSVIA